MARNKVGKATGETTSAGRPVYKTPEGELVSEKSVTFPIGDTWYNAPSIYDGERYTEDQVMEMVQSGKVKPTSTHKSKEEAIAAAKERSSGLLKYYDGGAVSQTDRLLNPQQHQVHTVNESQPQQYQPASNVGAYNPQPMAPTSSPAMADGGLLQEGGSVDPESGNDVPVGAMKEEVRDDIPAQLSEGEFVFPADVVRFIGLDRLMQLRQAAKEGLARMEEMGQMGNADEATMEDDGEFESQIDEILQGSNYEEEMPQPEGYAEGGVVETMNKVAAEEDLTATDEVAATRMKPSEIIRKDLEKGGLTKEEKLVMDTVISLSRTGKSALVQINNTVFVGTPKEEGRMKIHMFTQDSPTVLAKSIKRGIEVLKKSNINTISGTTKNSKLLDLLDNLGYPSETNQQGDTIYFKTRIA